MTNAFIKGTKDHGCKVIEDSPVERIETDGTNRVRAVKTRAGEVRAVL